jgi:hypothetical protein
MIFVILILRFCPYNEIRGHIPGAMTAIEIYKKLPKINCGKCGEANCMSFALMVSKAQAKLAGCPLFVGVEAEPAYAQVPGNSYEHVGNEIENEAVKGDFREVAEAIGGDYEPGPGKEAIRLKMLNEVYELRRDGLFKENQRSLDPWAKIIICDYLRRKGRRPLTGEWITLGHFPHTASHVKAFQNNAEKKIADHFKNNPDALKRRSSELGGAETGQRIKADYSFSFDLLPHLPLFLLFWATDEEFDVDCKVLFDRSAEDHIDIEYLAHLLEKFVEELTRN